MAGSPMATTLHALHKSKMRNFQQSFKTTLEESLQNLDKDMWYNCFPLCPFLFLFLSHSFIKTSSRPLRMWFEP